MTLKTTKKMNFELYMGIFELFRGIFAFYRGKNRWDIFVFFRGIFIFFSVFFCHFLGGFLKNLGAILI